MTYYERHLPHWQPEGAALFITWRLNESLPRTAEISRNQPGKAFAAMDRELDRAATGPRWLLDDRVAECVADDLLYGESKLGLYELRAWVLMASIKTFSARQANAILALTGQSFWQDESYDHWVRGRDELEKIARYIEENPVAAGLVERVEAWRWSSAFGKSE